MSTPDSRWLKQPVVLNYGVAVLSVIAAQLFAQWLQIHYDFEPLVPFICAMIFSAWFGGIKPGLLAIALSLLVFHYYFLIPIYPSGMEKEIPRLLVATVTSVIIVLLSAAQRRASEALRESELRFRQIAENIREVFWMTTPAMEDLLYVSPAYETVWGRSLESLRQRPQSFMDAIHGEDRERVVGILEGRRQQEFEVEYRIVRPDGSIRWIRDREFPVKDESGKVYRIAGVAEDITERKRAEDAALQIARKIQALSEQKEAHLRLVIDTIPTMAWSLLPDGAVDSVNQRWVEYTGLSLEQALEEPTRIVHPEDLPRVMAKWLVDMAAGEPSEDEMRLRRADGEYRCFLVRTVPLRNEQGTIVKWYGASTDIEDRKRAEDALRQSEERFAAFMDNLPGYAWMKDLQGRYVYVNPNVRGLPGYQSLGKTDAQIWPADLAAEYRANDQQVIAAKKPLHTVEHYLHEGKQRYMVGSKFPIFDKTGAVALVGGAGMDITERVEAEEALRESEQLLQLVLATLPVGVGVTDRMGDIVLVNAASKRIWGDVIVSGRERRAQSKGFWHDSGKRIAPTEWASVRAASEGKTSLNELIDIETFDGHRKTIQNSSAPIRNAEGLIVGTVVVNEDVTERVRAENALRESTDRLQHLSRRLLAVQEEERRHLSRELHDRVGQNLTVLNINLNIMRTILPSQANDELRTRLADSEKLVESTTAAIGNVVSELHPPMLDDHGLAPALDWYARQFSARTGISVAVRGLESAERPAREMEIVLFRIAQEALNNVLKHARASRVEITLGRSGSDYVMSVEDDGVGYDAAGERAAPHTGLGMVTMRERAQAVGGRFEVRAASGDGTRLTVRVPA